MSGEPFASTPAQANGEQLDRPQTPESLDGELDESQRLNRSSGSSGSLNSSGSRGRREGSGSGSRYDFGRFYQKSYLKDGTNYTQRRPMDNVSKGATGKTSFIKPANFSYERLASDSMGKPKKKGTGGLMSVLGGGGNVSSNAAIRAQMRRPTPAPPRSPSPGRMQNAEAIRLAAYPKGRPAEEDLAPIERLDWPCPASPAVLLPEIMAEKRKESGQGDGEDEEDGEVPTDPQLEREKRALENMESSALAKALLQDLERKWEKVRQLRKVVDPHNASRVPSADHEPKTRLRYESAMFASPSRVLGVRRRSIGDDRRRVQNGGGTMPSYSVSALPIPATNPRSGKTPVCSTPKPGYGLAPNSTRSLPGAGRHGGMPIHFSDDEGDSHRMSTELSTDDVFEEAASPRRRHHLADNRSDAAIHDVSDGDFRFKNWRSMGSMSGPPKIYDFKALCISTNTSLPRDVDKANLERHLAAEEFYEIFDMAPEEFRGLPEWRRNDLKKQHDLF